MSERIFLVQYCQFKKYHPSGNLKFNNLGLFQSLNLRILLEKNLLISFNVHFTPNTVGCYGLILNNKVCSLRDCG